MPKTHYRPTRPHRGGAARGQAGHHPGSRGYCGGQRGCGRGYGGQQHPGGAHQVYSSQQPPLLPLPPHGQQLPGQQFYGGQQARGPQQNGIPGTVLSNFLTSYSNVNHLSTCSTNHVSAGFPYVDDTYSHTPVSVVCQICFSPGHSALMCPRFVGSSTPALAPLPTGEHNASVWYPDSGASAHMTPHDNQTGVHLLQGSNKDHLYPFHALQATLVSRPI
ncbi:unnamed protein product [Cuscuta europaea]|uniref:Uncharacterized protein n=1 Tax=Cuscuta europaea TaxID=41803 RepID=A0A9P1ENA8_CUSEU|nr:unnamed protein product [Cuscuta europaea]